MDAAKLVSKIDAETKIRELAKLRADGGPSRLDEALEIARTWGIKESDVGELFDNAERLAAETWIESEEEAESFFKKPRAQPEVAKPSEPEPEEEEPKKAAQAKPETKEDYQRPIRLDLEAPYDIAR